MDKAACRVAEATKRSASHDGQVLSEVLAELRAIHALLKDWQLSGLPAIREGADE